MIALHSPPRHPLHQSQCHYHQHQFHHKQLFIIIVKRKLVVIDHPSQIRILLVKDEQTGGNFCVNFKHLTDLGRTNHNCCGSLTSAQIYKNPFDFFIVACWRLQLFRIKPSPHSCMPLIAFCFSIVLQSGLNTACIQIFVPWSCSVEQSPSCCCH